MNSFIKIYIYINKIQQDATDAGIYLLQNYSTCFGCLSHPSSVAHQTVPEAAITVWCAPDDGCDIFA